MRGADRLSPHYQQRSESLRIGRNWSELVRITRRFSGLVLSNSDRTYDRRRPDDGTLSCSLPRVSCSLTGEKESGPLARREHDFSIVKEQAGLPKGRR